MLALRTDTHAVYGVLLMNDEAQRANERIYQFLYPDICVHRHPDGRDAWDRKENPGMATVLTCELCGEAVSIRPGNDTRYELYPRIPDYADFNLLLAAEGPVATFYARWETMRDAASFNMPIGWVGRAARFWCQGVPLLVERGAARLRDELAALLGEMQKATPHA